MDVDKGNALPKDMVIPTMQSSLFMPSVWRFVLKLATDQTQRKYIFRWLESLEKNYFLKKRQPWLVFAAIDALNILSLENKRVFEYGSGGSTLFWLDKGAICVSVEHNYQWYKIIRQLTLNQSRIDYRLIEAKPITTISTNEPANPYTYVSDAPEFKNYTFEHYASQIDEFDNDSFDLVLVDGRARPACIRHATPKIKRGGYLVLDNAERDYYLQQTSVFLKNFHCQEFVGCWPSLQQIGKTNIYCRL